MSEARIKTALKKVGEGFFSGVASRFLTWAPEYGVLKKSMYGKNISYASIFSHLSKDNNFVDLHKQFPKTGFVQTIGKSGSNMAAASIVEHFFPDLSPMAKATAITGIGTPIETWATKKFERDKLKGFKELGTQNKEMKNTRELNKSELKRIRNVTAFRTFWATELTFGGIYKIEDWLKRKKLFSETAHPGTIKATASFIAGFILQPLIMPAIKIQNETFLHPDKSVIKQVKYLLKNNPTSFFDGAKMRMACQGLRYGAGFGMLELFKMLDKTPKLR